MSFKIKTVALILCAFFVSYGFFLPILFLNQLNTENYDLSSYKLMFDDSLFKNKNNQIIINFKKGVDLNQAKQKILGICDGISEPIEFEFISAISCEVSTDQLHKIAKLDTVEKIYLNEPVKIDIEPSLELSFDEIFQLNQCATHINARAVPYTGQGINISILDTGIDFTHSDLSGKKLNETSFVKTAYGFDADKEEDPMDYMGHGTHCAGIATGTGISSPSGYNLTGIAPNAKLLNAKCLSRFGEGYLSSILAGIEWSINQNAAIISMSLGFLSSDPDHPICRAVDNATKEGIIVVVSAGNSGPFFSTVSSPGSARSIITVGATDKQDKITDFSSRGSTLLGFTDPDVLAPGNDVLAPIAKNSIIEAIMEIEDYYVPGSSGNDYAILSGTSMSCPMVAGAVALILEAFPNLSPNQVRIALMEGADSLGYTPNEEGAGLVNVNKSYTTLLQAEPEFNISTVLPHELPIPPLEFSLFPGDTYIDDFIILLGDQTNMSVTCTGNISRYITLQNTSTNEIPVTDILLYIQAQDSFFTNLEVVFDIPLSIPTGYYSGTIEIRNNETFQLLETVDLSFNIYSPKGRIYFDCLHNSDYADHVRSNYYNFTKLLFEHKIAVTYGTSLLSFPLLSQYDLLILPDIELPLTARELAAIYQYWEQGGNVLTLGSFYPQTAIESLNDLLAALNAGINYTKTNFEQSYDLGLAKFYDDFLITEIEPHPITNGVFQFTWLNGVGLEVDPLKAKSLANYSGTPVISVFNQSEHKIVCMGSERIFYDDFLSYSYNEKLVLQTITWLLNDSLRSNSRALRVEVMASQPILELGDDNETNIGFYVFDPANSYVDNLVPHANLSCQVLYYNSGWTPVWIGNSNDVAGLGNGAYYFNFSTNIEGLYQVNITIENLSSSRAGIGLTYFNTTVNMPKIVESSLITTTNDLPDEYDDLISNDIYRNMDNVTLNITIHDEDTNADIQNVTCYITSLDTYRSDIKYMAVEMKNITTKYAVETKFSLVISPNYEFPAGSYTAFIEIIDTIGNSDYSSTNFDFYLNNKYPKIDSWESKLKGKPFQSLQSSLVGLRCGSDFTVEITGNDTESALQDMHAYVILFSYFTIGFYAYLYEPIWGTELPFSGSFFSGSLRLPANGVSQILDESYSLKGSFILIALLLDSDGQYDEDSYTYAMVNIKSPFPFLLIIIVIAIFGALAAFLYFWFGKKK